MHAVLKCAKYSKTALSRTWCRPDGRVHLSAHGAVQRHCRNDFLTAPLQHASLWPEISICSIASATCCNKLPAGFV